MRNCCVSLCNSFNGRWIRPKFPWFKRGKLLAESNKSFKILFEDEFGAISDGRPGFVAGGGADAKEEVVFADATLFCVENKVFDAVVLAEVGWVLF